MSPLPSKIYRRDLQSCQILRPSDIKSSPQENDSSHAMGVVSPTPCLYNDCDLIYSSGSVHSRVGSTFRSTHSLQSNITERSDKKNSSTEQEDKLVLSVVEKSLLVMVWTISFAYSILSPQVISDKDCNVREDLFSTLGMVSVFMVIIVPFILGPIGTFLALFLATIFSCCGARKNSDDEFVPHIFCLVGLTLLFIITYVISMIISEIYFEQINSIMYFILIKYYIGTLHHFLGPVIILLCYKDIRKSVAKVFMKGGTNQNESKDITDDQMKKELGHV